MDKKNTGYPHIDKPWMKWYENLDVNYEDPAMNLNNYIKEKVKNIKKNSTAQTYYGRKISYEELFSKIDDASRVFDQMRIKIEDRVMYFVPAIPETAQLWLGACQMGITSDFVDPRPDSVDIETSSKKILEIIKEEKAKYIVALDIFYLKILKHIEPQLKELGIEEIILVSATDSMTLSGKVSYLNDAINYYNLEKERELDNYIISLLTNNENEFSLEIQNVINKITNSNLNFEEKLNLIRTLKDKSIDKRNIINLIKEFRKNQLQSFKFLLERLKTMRESNEELERSIKNSPLKIYRYSELVNECKNANFTTTDDVDLTVYIGHTSGTSSKPKAIPATTKNLISAIEQLFKAGHQFNRGQRMLQFFAPYAPIGGVDSFLLNLASGANSVIIPEIVFDDFWYIVNKEKPSGLLLPPTILTNLFKNKHMVNSDLSYIERVIYGGGGITEKEEMLANTTLSFNGSSAKVEVGHGQSEYMGCGAYGKGPYKVYESIGIPLPDTIYTIVDPDSSEMVPLRFNDGDEYLYGELAVSSDAITKGILDGRIITKHYTMDGREYIKTNDLVRMDRNGIFYHESRKDNVFTRFDGYKVSPYAIEKAIEENKHVVSCSIVPYFDKDKGGNMPIAHLVLNEDLDEASLYDLIHDIIYTNIMSNKDFNSRLIPSMFKIRKKLPATKNGKVDFRSLASEQLDGSEIKVTVNETSTNVDGIIIEMPSPKNVRVR